MALDGPFDVEKPVGTMENGAMSPEMNAGRRNRRNLWSANDAAPESDIWPLAERLISCQGTRRDASV
jgi:hypothetical protein